MTIPRPLLALLFTLSACSQTNNKPPAPNAIDLTGVRILSKEDAKTYLQQSTQLRAREQRQAGGASYPHRNPYQPPAKPVLNVLNVQHGLSVGSAIAMSGTEGTSLYGANITKEQPISTFAADVDSASYTLVRNALTNGDSLGPNRIRIEEMLNYFQFDYPEPVDGEPFRLSSEIGPSPWNGNERVLRIGLRGAKLAAGMRPPANLVFLIDVSGSMDNTLSSGLARNTLQLLTENLNERDRVAVLSFSDDFSVELESTPGDMDDTIMSAIDQMEIGGGTNGGTGMLAAYLIAEENMLPAASNRVVLLSDGDFNVDMTDDSSLSQLVRTHADKGIALTVLGFGQGRGDHTLELLANRGDGNYHRIDSQNDARRVVVDQLHANLHTVARDVKLQIEFDPALVESYRLVGYDNRRLENQQFHDDKVDGGDVGAGHNMTALYEYTPTALGKDANSQHRPMATVRARFKLDDDTDSQLVEHVVYGPGASTITATSDEFRFALAVARLGEALKGRKSYLAQSALDMAVEAMGARPDRQRLEFLGLLEQAGCHGVLDMESHVACSPQTAGYRQ